MVGRLPLKRKLLLGLGLLCVATVVVALFAFWGLSTVTALTSEKLGPAVRLARIAGEVAEQTLQCRRFEKDMFLNLGDPAEFARYQKQWQQAYAALQAGVAEFGSLAAAEDKTVVERWTRLHQDYRTAMEQVMQAVRDGKIQTAMQANQSITPYKDSIRDLTDLATTTAQRKMTEVTQAETDLEQVALFFKTLILIVTVVALVGCLAWSYKLSVEVTRPIQEVCRAVDQIAAGDLHVQVPVDGDDEIARLANSFNRMTAQLRDKAASSPP